jgi:hypothetical protein
MPRRTRLSPGDILVILVIGAVALYGIWLLGRTL